MYRQKKSKKRTGIRFEDGLPSGKTKRHSTAGAPEPFYQQITARPALRIEIGKTWGQELTREELSECTRDIRILPLEYIFSYTSGLVS